ncbi:MAG TPA: hypothetical protein DCZ95_00575 [Verrucomicrobia bacterium]|nr:MAG: hypothetical protein A2X46_05785 [Lentisphaerae bacterium GWF2_57_35]HBA82564.1 hypothetical protein [Verrucomicrobiota bacterium]
MKTKRIVKLSILSLVGVILIGAAVQVVSDIKSDVHLQPIDEAAALYTPEVASYWVSQMGI